MACWSLCNAYQYFDNGFAKWKSSPSWLILTLHNSQDSSSKVKAGIRVRPRKVNFHVVFQRDWALQVLQTLQGNLSYSVWAHYKSSESKKIRNAKKKQKICLASSRKSTHLYDFTSTYKMIVTKESNTFASSCFWRVTLCGFVRAEPPHQHKSRARQPSILMEQIEQLCFESFCCLCLPVALSCHNFGATPCSPFPCFASPSVSPFSWLLAPLTPRLWELSGWGGCSWQFPVPVLKGGWGKAQLTPSHLFDIAHLWAETSQRCSEHGPVTEPTPNVTENYHFWAACCALCTPDTGQSSWSHSTPCYSHGEEGSLHTKV